MMAQRFPDAHITAIDIDNDACQQATENVADSPFSGRIKVLHTSLKDFASTHADCYDSIFSNPPYFEENLNCPDKARNDARHTSSLPFSELISCSKQLLTDDGTVTLILPSSALSRIESECAYANMFIVRKIYIRTTEKKVPKRVVIYIRKHPSPTESETQTLMVNSTKSPWYEALTETFYLPHSPSGEHA
jgi:tRNA1Val (adenine37-N6)-methyltransferase